MDNPGPSTSRSMDTDTNNATPTTNTLDLRQTTGKGKKRKLQANKKERSNIHQFWNTHYEADQGSEGLLAADIYQFFKTTTYYKDQTWGNFLHNTNMITDLPSVKNRNTGQKVYKVSCITISSRDYHRSLHEYSNSPAPTRDEEEQQTPTQHSTDPAASNDTTDKHTPANPNSAEGHITPTSKSNNRDRIASFWGKHYHTTSRTTQIPQKDIYQFFVQQYNTLPIPVTQKDFHQITMRINKVHKKQGKKTSTYYAAPVSKEATIFHSTNQKNTPSQPKGNTQTELHMLNLNGIISQKGNKSKYLQAITQSANQNKIIAITETHLKPGHQDAEITNTFQNYSIAKCW